MAVPTLTLQSTKILGQYDESHESRSQRDCKFFNARQEFQGYETVFVMQDEKGCLYDLLNYPDDPSLYGHKWGEYICQKGEVDFDPQLALEQLDQSDLQFEQMNTNIIEAKAALRSEGEVSDYTTSKAANGHWYLRHISNAYQDTGNILLSGGVLTISHVNVRYVNGSNGIPSQQYGDMCQDTLHATLHYEPVRDGTEWKVEIDSRDIHGLPEQISDEANQLDSDYRAVIDRKDFGQVWDPENHAYQVENVCY